MRNEKSRLHTELLKQQFDTVTLPSSYHCGGVSDPCRIEPDDIIVFFYNPKTVLKGLQSWCHQRYQLKCNLYETGNIGIDGLNFRLAGDQGILIFPFQLHQLNMSEPQETRNFMTISFLDRSNVRDSLLRLQNRPFSITEADLELLNYLTPSEYRRKNKPVIS